VQASQQLAKLPTHAEPPFGALQLAALDFVEHFVTPLLVRQQVTNPGLPQVDRAAHFTTAPLQLGFVVCNAVFAAPVAHFTYWPWFVKLSQGHAAATAARAAATLPASAPVTSHFAALCCAVSPSSDSAITVTR
jgi:hypothetical protein